MNNPDLYNKANGLIRRAAIICLEEYVPQMKWVRGEGKIIDLGCGDGSVSKIMRKYVPKNYTTFVSCDFNEKMLEYAREHCAEDNIRFRVQDVEGQLDDDLKCSFDQVFSFFLLHWIRDQEKGFSNIYSLLKGGGDCLLTLLKYSPGYEIYLRMAKDTKWGDNWLQDLSAFITPYYHIQKPEKVITDMLEKIGFINIKVEVKEINYDMENGTELRNLIKAVEPYDMPKDVFEEFLLDSIPYAQDLGILDKGAKTYEDHDRIINYCYKLIVIYASKPTS